MGDPRYLVVGADGKGAPLAEDSLFPVASITKLATALAVLRLGDGGGLLLDEPLARYLPNAAAAVQPGVTLRTMLSHTAGLPYDLPDGAVTYGLGLNWPTLRDACLATPALGPARERFEYSNLGPGLLAAIVERFTSHSFPDALKALVLDPLEVEGYLGVAGLPRPAAHIAGDYGPHAGAPTEPFNSPFWRSLALPWGGLVTTAEGCLRLVRAFGGEPRGFLSLPLTAEATRDQTGGVPGRMIMLEWPRAAWGLGADLRGDKRPHFAPAEAAANSYGHVGASGAMVGRDPIAGVDWAILGPRVFTDWRQHWPAIGKAVLEALR